MKPHLLILTLLGLITWASLSTAEFEVRIKPNSIIPDVDVYSNDPSLIKYNHSRAKLKWATAPTVLTSNASSSAHSLKKQTLNFGLRVTNSNSQVVKTLEKKPFQIHREYPRVNPEPGSTSTFGMSLHHTGGGGAPTALKGSSPFNRANNSKTPVTTGGLRSDGELLQDKKKPRNLINHELSHTQQQSGVIDDSKNNKATQRE